MKKGFTLFLSLSLAFFSQAQWSNTTNQFYDSLHMPVVTATGTQQNEVVIKSYPDSGYFVIWEDLRTMGNQSDIYAQKYDKNGKALWASNGVAIAATTDDELLSLSTTIFNSEYRYSGHACTDSAGGFYLVWTANPGGFGERVRAQHILPDGSPRFAASGFDVATGTDLIYYPSAQLVADGRKGCFISFIKDNRDGGKVDLYVYDYLDENGTMTLRGGKQVDEYAEERQTITQCGIQTSLVYPDVNVIDYNIYPDGQGGCNIVFSYLLTSTYTNLTSRRIGFNQLCRVKKESNVTVLRRTNDQVNATRLNYTLKKDSVVMLYNLKTYSYTANCNSVSVFNQLVETQGEGFQALSDTSGGAAYAKGTVATTDGIANINVNIMAAEIQHGSAFYKELFIRPQEIYDSIPYQISTDTTHPYQAYKPVPNVPLNTLNEGNDTLLAGGYHGDEFALASSNNRIFAAGHVTPAVQSSLSDNINLTQLQVDRITADSFAVRYHTPKSGATIGKELNASPGISYRRPFIATDLRGNAVFSIVDNDHLIYVSPVADSGRLVWGAMGKPVGSGYSGSSYYNTYTPYTVMDPTNGTAVIAWTDTRVVGSTSTAFNIFARHLDSLNYYNYQPPQRGAAPLYYNGVFANPTTLVGLSHTWNYFEGNDFTTGITSTMSAIYDNYNLGTVTASALDHADADGNAIRRYNTVPYLDRNYTISVEHNPNGAATIDVQLYFTNAQFAALQKADPTIGSPADLIVIKQPKGTLENPSEYTPVAGEELIAPTAWSAVEGGYYIQLQVSSFSYFFIKKNDAILPVKWVSLSAERNTNNTANITWSVANEVNVKSYLLQYSEDGIHYKDGCVVNANNAGTYGCSLPIGNGQYFIKIKETDLDGRSSYSNLAMIDKLLQGLLFVVLPNPVKSNATLRYAVPAPAKASLRLLAANGAAVWQQSTTLSSLGTLSIPMNGLPAGIYSLQIVFGKEKRVLKIVKE